MSEQTDTIEAVALWEAVREWQWPDGTTPREWFMRLLATYTAAHTKALVAGAGELCERLEDHARAVGGDDSFERLYGSEAVEAAATIAALRAENERLELYVEAFRREERRADDLAQKLDDARIEGVRAGIEASAHKATSFLVGDPVNDVPLRNPMAHEIADAIRALDPAAIIRAQALSELAAADAVLLDMPEGEPQ